MFEKRTIIKTIKNDSESEIFTGDVLLAEINNLAELGLDCSDCRLFRSGRHKNDMPSVCRFGHFDDAMKDCTVTVRESGDGSEEHSQNIIISDHLTVLGKDDNAVLIAFCGGMHHLIRTEIRIDEKGNFLDLKVFAELNCTLKPQESRDTEKVEVFHTDNVAQAIKNWATERKCDSFIRKKQPGVFCTWYYYEQTVTFDDVRLNLEKITEKQLPFDVFQLDDGWEFFPGEWTPNEKFPSEMKTVAAEIEKHNLTPGIWTSPFIAHKSANLWKSHPDWILRNKEGEPEIFNVNNTDFFIVDITIKETLAYFEELYRRLTFDWGFRYHKLDFTRAPFVAKNPEFSDKHRTPVECYREAVLAIRQGMGDESFFLMCGGLYDPLIGIVDAQRTGSDVLSMWSSTINKNGKTLPYTVKQSLLRYYMNNWWHNDPDALVIRRNEKTERGTRLTYGLLTDDEVKTSTLNQLTGGGIVCSTEPLDKIDEDRLANLRHVLPVRPVETEIAGLMNSERFPDRIRIFDKNDQSAVHLVLINWSDTETIAPVITPTEIAGNSFAFKDGEKYSLRDFYSRVIFEGLTPDSEIRLKEIPPHSSTILKLSQTINSTDFSGHYLD